MKIIDEIRKISSEQIAKKQNSAKNKYPKLIEDIKIAAKRGDKECEFRENEIDEYSKKLLEADGFTVYTTSRKSKLNDYKDYLGQQGENIMIWVVRW